MRKGLFKTIIFLATTTMVGGVLASTASANNSRGAKASAATTGDQYRYELRALGAKAGEVVLTIGDLTKVGDTQVRPLRMDAKTDGLAAKFIAASTASTTWVDTSWLPVRARWDWKANKLKQIIKATYKGRKVDATDERGGKIFRRVNHTTKTPGVDVISVFPWLMQQDLSPGAQYVIPVFDGRRIYTVTVTAGLPKEIHLPIGLRKAIPLKATVARGSYKRDMELWVGADAARTPFKMTFKYGLLGKVEAILVGAKKKAA